MKRRLYVTATDTNEKVGEIKYKWVCSCPSFAIADKVRDLWSKKEGMKMVRIARSYPQYCPYKYKITFVRSEDLSL